MRCTTAIGLALSLSVACTIQQDRAGARAAIRDAELAFAAATLERGADGWTEFMADSAVIIRPHPPPLHGRAAIRQYYSRVFTPGFTLLWRPIHTDVAQSGELGYAIGEWEAITKPAGTPRQVSYGRYVTIWQKDARGEWKVLLDIGNPDSTMTGIGSEQ